MKIKELILGLIFLTGFVGCASNTASFRHFPSSNNLDFEKIDSVQKSSDKPHRFFYNCNFENDFLIKADLKEKKEAEEVVKKSLKNSGYGLIKSSDSIIIAERGTTLWEWKTLAVIYTKNIKESTFLYLKTEISQDFTCGPNINRAKTIVKNICTQDFKCIEVKEITDKTKRTVWPTGEMDGGLENEQFENLKYDYPVE